MTVIAALLHPDKHGHGTHQQLGLPPCPSVLLFDRPCPGCGLTTSWTALMHGDFAHAFAAHPLGPLLYLAFTISAFLCLYGWRKGLLLETDTPSFNWRFGVALTIFLGFGFFRMATTPHFASPQERFMVSFDREMRSR
ncbi:hypothetical protein OP10G_4046 [Fimbriimonas ginsengisoli Gsoil 348]|uniref:DUF2752 domain-containing protein n=1 Tax=Fimbriimonas ginsengisoli Gsoil 348 TaxID=661478 RepID=A0A068NYU1_FIMGI|nr:hypothetical protein OP10G_4046 [Fimbriimonas ginsengisoli Gsoil 348]